MNQGFPHRMHSLSFLHFLPCEQLGDFNGWQTSLAAWQKHVSEPQSEKSDVRPKKVSPTMFVVLVGLLTDSNSHKYK